MGYLLYVSHEAENLQFYLWFQDYSKRFFQTSKTEQVLSPPWDEDSAQPVGTDLGPTMMGPRSGLGPDFKLGYEAKDIPLEHMSGYNPCKNGFVKGNPLQSVEFANAQMGLKWQSCE